MNVHRWHKTPTICIKWRIYPEKKTNILFIKLFIRSSLWIIASSSSWNFGWSEMIFLKSTVSSSIGLIIWWDHRKFVVRSNMEIYTYGWSEGIPEYKTLESARNGLTARHIQRPFVTTSSRSWLLEILIKENPFWECRSYLLISLDSSTVTAFLILLSLRDGMMEIEEDLW